MSTRTRTIGSFFTVAMGAMLFGAVVTSQVNRPSTVLASAAAPAPRPRGPVTLDSFRDVARLQTPGVVNINTSKMVKRSQREGGEDLFEQFFGPLGRRGGGGGERERQQALGSGFIVDKDGWIMTNRHVIEGADEISVTLSTGQTYDAKLKGKDARTDVALLKIEPRSGAQLTVLNLGDSDQTEVGEWVMAIGNPFGLGGNSVTAGLVSYKGRPLTLGTQNTSVDMIQTDASINPGNSGGPLLNMQGEVIGINTLIITRGLPQSSGVGFAVPINVAKDILPQLRDKGRVTRGWMGVSLQNITEDLAKSLRLKEVRGAYISDVTAGSPAEKAGLLPDDVVVRVDGRDVKDNGDLQSYVASRAPGATVKLEINRDGKTQTISVTLGTFPDETELAEARQQGTVHLGMSLQDLTGRLAEQLELPRTTKGVVVTEVEAGEAADRAQLQRGDVIVAVNGRTVESVADFEARIAESKVDGVARLRVRRGDGFTVLVLKIS